MMAEISRAVSKVLHYTRMCIWTVW